jgi:hypothetical protein
MKMSATLAVVAGVGMLGAMILTGCAAGPTPAYTGDERAAQIGRNWDFEWEQLADDTDNVLLLRPSSTLTQWNVIHRE